MPCGFYRGFVFADDAVRLNKCCRLQEFAAAVALVAAGFFATAVGAFAFDKAVGQETLVMFAVEHLGVLREYVAVFLDFQQGFLHEFFVDWAFGAGVIVKRGVPFAEELRDVGVVAVS